MKTKYELWQKVEFVQDNKEYSLEVDEIVINKNWTMYYFENHAISFVLEEDINK